MSFTQAEIAVQNERAVAELKSLISNAVSEQRIDSFLHTMKRFGYKVREFEKVLEDHILEQMPGAAASKPAEELYGGMNASDQGLVREFYLTEIEKVPVEWRRKYKKLYQYA